MADNRDQQGKRFIPPDSPQGTDLSRLLTTTHKKYNEYLPLWERYHDCYHGLEMNKYLVKHLRESGDSLAVRKKRAYYLNYCEPVIDLFTHYLFSKPISRKYSLEDEEDTSHQFSAESKPTKEDVANSEEETDPSVSTQEYSSGGEGEEDVSREEAEWTQWLKNVDRQGNSIDRFMSITTKLSFIFGHIGIVVDMPTSENEINTEQDRMEQGVRPYLSYYYPQDIINFATDSNNELLWIRLVEEPPQEENPFILDEKRQVQERRESSALMSTLSKNKMSRKHIFKDSDVAYIKTWTRDDWYLHKVYSNGEVVLIDSGDHPCQMVPVVFQYNTKDIKFRTYGKSMLANIAPINIAIYNWSSLVDEEIYQKCLNILCLQKNPGSSSEVIIGSNNTLEYDGAPPFFLAPATDPGAFIQAQIERMRDEIMRIAKLGGGLGIEVQSQQSGISHAFEFNETNRTLAEKADEVESAENKVHKLYHLWLNQPWAGSVDYPDNFSVESFDSELQLAMNVKSAVNAPTLHQEMDKRVIKKVLHNAPFGVLEQIYAELQLQYDQQREMLLNPPDPNDPNNPNVEQGQQKGNNAQQGKSATPSSTSSQSSSSSSKASQPSRPS